MKSVKIKYQQLIFLYAYLRLIDLSLDRSRWGEWDNFLAYFKNIISPSIVILYLTEHFELTEAHLNQNAAPSQKKTINKKLNAIFLNDFSLGRDEILCCCKLLSDFEKILKSDNKVYHLYIEALRQNIAQYYTVTLENLIKKKDLKRLMRIEHFNQSELTDTLKIDTVIPFGLSLPGYAAQG